MSKRRRTSDSDGDWSGNGPSAGDENSNSIDDGEIDGGNEEDQREDGSEDESEVDDDDVIRIDDDKEDDRYEDDSKEHIEVWDVDKLSELLTQRYMFWDDLETTLRVHHTRLFKDKVKSPDRITDVTKEHEKYEGVVVVKYNKYLETTLMNIPMYIRKLCMVGPQNMYMYFTSFAKELCVEIKRTTDRDVDEQELEHIFDESGFVPNTIEAFDNFNERRTRRKTIFEGGFREKRRELVEEKLKSLEEKGRRVVSVVNVGVIYVSDKPIWTGDSRMEQPDDGLQSVRHLFNDHRYQNNYDRDRLVSELTAVAKEAMEQVKSLSKAGVTKNEILKVLRFYKDHSVLLMNNVFARLRSPRGELVIERAHDRSRRSISYFEHKDLARSCEFVVKFPQWHGKDEKWVVKDCNVLLLWSRSPRALVYTRKEFNPTPYHDTQNCSSLNVLNLFTGMEIKVDQQWFVQNDERLRQLSEHVKPFTDHLRGIICGGMDTENYSEPKEEEKFTKSVDEQYKYMLQWICWTYVRPEVKLDQVPVLISRPGGGKNILIDKIKELLGAQYVSQPTRLSDATKEFNEDVLGKCLLLFFDETRPPSDATRDAIKKLITDKESNIGQKFKSTYRQQTYFNVIKASNQKEAVYQDAGERRYIFPTMSNKYAGRHRKDSEPQKHFQTVAKVNARHLAQYLCMVFDEQWCDKDVPVICQSTDRIIAMLSGLPRFLFEMINDPQKIIDPSWESRKKAGPSSTDPFGKWLYRDDFILKYRNSDHCEKDDEDVVKIVSDQGQEHIKVTEKEWFKKFYDRIRDFGFSVDKSDSTRNGTKNVAVLRFGKGSLATARQEFESNHNIQIPKYDTN